VACPNAAEDLGLGVVALKHRGVLGAHLVMANGSMHDSASMTAR
jgi:hypothetical protein